MKNIYLWLLCWCSLIGVVHADSLRPSTATPDLTPPAHLYTITNGNNWSMNASTSPTQNAEKKALFAFYAVENRNNAYYIYNYTAQQWVGYQRKAAYSPQRGFVQLTKNCPPESYWVITPVENDYQIQPVSLTNDAATYYMNWFQGVGAQSNPADGNITIGLWSDGGAKDAGSRWHLTEIDVARHTYILQAPEELCVTYHGDTLRNGMSFHTIGTLHREELHVLTPQGQFAIVQIDDHTHQVKVSAIHTPQQPASKPYDLAIVYPQTSKIVGTARLQQTNGVYTLYNEVLAASYLNFENQLYFAGSQALGLEGGSELFAITLADGTTIAASDMQLKEVKEETLHKDPKAVKGSEHYDGKALVAHYTYPLSKGNLSIIWRAILRDGSHYLRTTLEVSADHPVNFRELTPLHYTLLAKEVTEKPAISGDTRGSLIVSNRLFAGLETPMGVQKIGTSNSSEPNKILFETTSSWKPSDWKEASPSTIPSRINEVGFGHPNVVVKSQPFETTATGQLQVIFEYEQGTHRLNIVGVDLVDAQGDAIRGDYHYGYTGGEKHKNQYDVEVPYPGKYTLRFFCENKTETITSSGHISVQLTQHRTSSQQALGKIPIYGIWERPTTLPTNDVWKVSSVVGLMAPQQARRTILAYSERERAVPWRPFPHYNSWYEINIDRTNKQVDYNKNMQVGQTLDVIAQWKKHLYDRYHQKIACFVWDDGWDEYGTWTFNKGFPHGFQEPDAAAREMGAGTGCWLGPVGGYDVAGGQRRKYWTDRGERCELSNPNYYRVFQEACQRMVKNYDFRFFKFDGISDKFAAKGPAEGPSGIESAEGILRVERDVRENLRKDIFFNTTVGTWASPFWYHYSDATWRQERDWWTLGDQGDDRERWITYRDALVYSNYVQGAPLCPINTLMTHGFILTKHGQVSKSMDFEGIVRELRCAFACGSGMVELYADYPLLNQIHGGRLWGEIAACIAWQKEQADVLPDIHWVGGNPWTGSKTEVYGWAAWNGEKAVITLRNGADYPQKFVTTLRKMLEVPTTQTSSVRLYPAFQPQDKLPGLPLYSPIDLDTPLTLHLPAHSVFVFNGSHAVGAIPEIKQLHLNQVAYTTKVGETFTAIAQIQPTAAWDKNLTWTTDNSEIAVVDQWGVVHAKRVGRCHLIVTSTSGMQAKGIITVRPKNLPEYFTSFPKDLPAEQTKKYIKTVSILSDGRWQHAETDTLSKKPYQALNAIFEVTPGAVVTPHMEWNGSGLYSFVYCDHNQNHQFDVPSIPAELVSYTYLAGKDSAGNSKEQHCGVEGLPAFTAPVKNGLYRLRFKVDEDYAGAEGSSGPQMEIVNVGGGIVDIWLKVVNSTGISSIANRSIGQSIYDLFGRKHHYLQKGVQIVNGEKIYR